MPHQLLAPDDTMKADDAVSTRTNTQDPLSEMAYHAVTPACDRLGVRHFDRIKRMRAILADLSELHHAGASEAELREYEHAIASHIDGLTAHVVDSHAIARQELDADTAEDQIEGLIAIEGRSPVLLEKYASALRKQSATSRVKARDVAREARQARQNRTVAAQRLGVGGAA